MKVGTHILKPSAHIVYESEPSFLIHLLLIGRYYTTTYNMGLVESLKRISGARRVFCIKNDSLPVSAVSGVSAEQRTSLISMREKAHIIAGNVRNYGEQKFGPLWAQGYVVLSDGRIVFLQQSLGEAQAGGALVINIPPTSNDPYSTHIRYDLGRDEIKTYEIYRRQEEGKQIIAQMIYDRSDQRTQVPANLTLRDITGSVEKILQLVQIASNKIILTKPEPTPHSSPVRL